MKKRLSTNSLHGIPTPGKPPLSKAYRQMAVLPILAVALAACSQSGSNGNSGTEGQAPAADNGRDEPVELVFYADNGDSQESFDSLYGNPLRAKFPNMTIKYYNKKPGHTLPELLAQKEPVDVLISTLPYLFGAAMNAGLEYDMTELVKQQKVDLNKFEPTLIDGITLSGDGKLYALPLTNMVQVMFYNQSIFDKFGVPYPKNGMFWDETMGIAQKLTRLEEGKQYLGFLASPAHMLRGNQLSQPYLDPATDKPTFLNETWKTLMQTYFLNPASDERYKSRVTALKRFPTRTHFTETQEIAMFVFNSQFPFTVPKDMASIQWNLASLPTFPDRPNIGSAATPFTMAITSISRNKEAALRAIDFLTSPENQLEYSKQGIMPVIRDSQVKQAYGQASDFKDKNWSAVFHNQYAPMAKFSRYHLAVENILNTVPLDAIIGTKDLNTALREAAEAAEKTITDMKNGN